MILEDIAGRIALHRQDNPADGVFRRRIAVGAVVHGAAMAADGFVQIVISGRLGFDHRITGWA